MPAYTFIPQLTELEKCLLDKLDGETRTDNQSVPKVLLPGHRGRSRQADQVLPGQHVVHQDEWRRAIRPYNLRLESSVGPLAVVYRQSAFWSIITVADITHAISCASLFSIPIVARSGGHSYGAYSSGGSLQESDLGSAQTATLDPRLSIKSPKARRHEHVDPDQPIPGEPSLILDMRPIRSITYDPVEETVTVGSGALLGEMNEYLERFGRTVPSGACPTVGVGGQALAGGFGLMSRSLGLLLDSLVEMKVVLADGKVVSASKSIHPDLFWAMRGAGPSFGIAHSLTFRTHPIPTQVQYFEITLLPRSLPASATSIDRAARLYEAFEDFGESEDMVPEWGMSWHVTPEPSPHGLGDRASGSSPEWGTKVEVLGQFHGSLEAFERVKEKFMRRIRAKGEQEVQVGHRSLTFLESMHNVGGNWTRLQDRPLLNTHEHVNFYAKSILTKSRIPTSQIHTQLSHLLPLSSVHNPSTGTEWFILSPFLGGPASSVVRFAESERSAFAHRDLRVVWELYAKDLIEASDGEDKASRGGAGEDLVNIVRGMSEALEPVQAVYPAYVDPLLTAAQYPQLVWGSAYPRLQDLKAKYDPLNVFRYPQSVRMRVDSLEKRSFWSGHPDGTGRQGGGTYALVVLGVMIGLLLWLAKRARARSKLRLE